MHSNIYFKEVFHGGQLPPSSILIPFGGKLLRTMFNLLPMSSIGSLLFLEMSFVGYRKF
jgi:hypothetical protein